jgi:hypothetical protein
MLFGEIHIRQGAEMGLPRMERQGPMGDMAREAGTLKQLTKPCQDRKRSKQL